MAYIGIRKCCVRRNLRGPTFPLFLSQTSLLCMRPCKTSGCMRACEVRAEAPTTFCFFFSESHATFVVFSISRFVFFLIPCAQILEDTNGKSCMQPSERKKSFRKEKQSIEGTEHEMCHHAHVPSSLHCETLYGRSANSGQRVGARALAPAPTCMQPRGTRDDGSFAGS